MFFVKKTCCTYKWARRFFILALCALGFFSAVYDRLLEGLAVKKSAGPFSGKQAQIVRNFSLDKERQDQEKRDEQSTHGEKVHSIVSATSDKYTQTEAFLSLPDMQKLIAKHYNIKPYQKLIDAIVTNERRYKDNFYVFYHGTDNSWRLPQDLYTQLYAYFNPFELPATSQEFTFLRFEDISSQPKAKDFLVNELKNNGLVNDHGKMGAILLSVNLSLFGNVGDPSECTWEYFIKTRGHLAPDRKIFEKIMDKFHVTHKYIDELMALTKLYETKEETIIQIFVPKNKIDEIGYLAWVKGLPADEETIAWIESHVKNKAFTKRSFAIVDLTDQFKQEQEKNPLFKNLIARAEKGDFSLDSFLNVYRNRPQDIKNINTVSARLIFTPDVLLNPASGVKFFRYSTATPEQLKRYHERLNEVVNKIIAEKSSF